MVLPEGQIFTGHVEIKDVTGRSLWKNEYSNANHIEIPVLNLPQGVYIVTLYKNDNTSWSSKLMVQH